MDVFAKPATPGIIATGRARFILTGGIAETFAIAKTTPFVTQPTESALARRDSSEKSNFFASYCRFELQALFSRFLVLKLVLFMKPYHPMFCVVEKCIHTKFGRFCIYKRFDSYLVPGILPVFIFIQLRTDLYIKL